MKNNRLFLKFFFSFWVICSSIILIIVAITLYLSHTKSLNFAEKNFINSYSSALASSFKKQKDASLFEEWFQHIDLNTHLELYLLSSNGTIIGKKPIPTEIRKISQVFRDDGLPSETSKSDDYVVSYTFLTHRHIKYRIASFSSNAFITPFTHIPLNLLIYRLAAAILVSGVICYFLTSYLTTPIVTLRNTVGRLSKGDLDARVNQNIQGRKDELGALGTEFNLMADRLQSLMQSKEQLLQDISHELRSPIARLQVALELARNKAEDLAHDELDRIELESNRLSELIGEILSLSKLNSESRQLDRSTCDLSELIKQVVEDANFESKSLRVTFKSRANLLMEIDKTLITRAIENIIRNALRYTPLDKTIDVSLIPSSNEVAIVVADHGPGVPENDLQSIFDPFYRVDRSREKKTGGYGLGLAITKQAISLHKGTIIAKNRREGGLIITVVLPKKKSSNGK